MLSLHWQVWYHQENEYTTAVFVNDYTYIPEFPRLFVALQLTLTIHRAGRGILVRYALPILILLLLSAATFWADINTRIDTTMTILLSVSALYVVIIQGQCDFAKVVVICSALIVIHLSCFCLLLDFIRYSSSGVPYNFR